MLRTVIIDDEAHIRDTLRKLLERHCPKVAVVGEASGVAEGIKAIKKLHPGLVFLDLNLGDGTGFGLLSALDTIDFNIIFISAFDKTTIQAFRLSGVEYLMKPVNPVEIGAAINRVMDTELKYFALQIEALEMNMRSVTSLK